MKASDLMTRKPTTCTPDQTAEKAAQLMLGQDCGLLPVVETGSDKVIGTVTDRDLAVRVLAKGKGPDTKIRDAMSDDPSWCRPDDDIERVERIMEERQVRRVPVVNDQGSIVGIIAQADLARHRGAEVPDSKISEVVDQISRPRESPRA